MASDTAQSDLESIFGDAEDAAFGTLKAGGKRRQLVTSPGLLQTPQERKTKRTKHASKGEKAEDSHSCRLDGESLNAVKNIIDEGIAKAVQVMNRKYDELEKRTEILEAELFEKSHQVDALRAMAAHSDSVIQSLSEQLENMDVNRRMNTLILRCEDFGRRTKDENLEGLTAEILNSRFPDMKISPNDFQTVHRLQNDKSVICKFLQSKLRNELYERRFETTQGKRGARDRTTPLFVNESLTAKNSLIFNTLLVAKRDGLIYTVYTRRGLVHFKADRESRGRRVDDECQLKTIIENAKRGAAVPPVDRAPRLGAPLAAELASSRGGVGGPERLPGPAALPAVGGRPAAAVTWYGPRPAEAGPSGGPSGTLPARLDAPVADSRAARPPPGLPTEVRDTGVSRRADGHGAPPGDTREMESNADAETVAAGRSVPAAGGGSTSASGAASAVVDAASEVVDAAPGVVGAADPPSDAAAPAEGGVRGGPVPSAIAGRLMRFAYAPAEARRDGTTD